MYQVSKNKAVSKVAMINGFRCGMIGISELNIPAGLTGLMLLALVLFLVSIKLFREGYHLKI